MKPHTFTDGRSFPWGNVLLLQGSVRGTIPQGQSPWNHHSCSSPSCPSQKPLGQQACIMAALRECHPCSDNSRTRCDWEQDRPICHGGYSSPNPQLSCGTDVIKILLLVRPWRQILPNKIRCCSHIWFHQNHPDFKYCLYREMWPIKSRVRASSQDPRTDAVEIGSLKKTAWPHLVDKYHIFLQTLEKALFPVFNAINIKDFTSLKSNLILL